jgi:hypothetical protein
VAQPFTAAVNALLPASPLRWYFSLRNDTFRNLIDPSAITIFPGILFPKAT